MTKNPNHFEQIIQAIELYSNQHHLNHRFVGGVSFGGLLNDKTTWDIHIPEKTITLHAYTPLTLQRNDRTTRDVDLILFCENVKKITSLRHAIVILQKKYKKAQKPFPEFTVEGAIYPSFGKRNWLTQYVTALEIEKKYHKEHLYLVFDAIQQEISWQSIEPWYVVLDDNVKYTVRNPIADYYAYLFRSPGGPKPKDKTKISRLKRLADAVIAEGQKQTEPIDFMSDEYYGTWQRYVKQLETTTDPDIIIKKMIAQMYWNTLGTTLAHQGGLFSFFANQFTGIKQ